MIAARLRSIDICDLYAAGWRGVGIDGREVGPCGTAMEVVERLTREAVCARP